MSVLEPTVFVVDHDVELQRTLRRLLESVRLRVEVFANAREFMECCDPARPGCLILEVRMRGMSGLELFRWLREKGNRIPVIFVTEHGDIPMAVQAMRAGAFHFLQKPVNEQYLLDQTHAAIAQDRQNRREEAERRAVRDSVASLSAREREVLNEIITGKTNKAMSLQFGVSIKTVEFHRANVMRKIGAENVVELVHRLIRGGWEQTGGGRAPKGSRLRSHG